MIQEYKNILNTYECNELIKIAKPKLVNSKILGEQIKDYRTAQNTWLFEKSIVCDKIKNIISEKTNLPIENQENIHIVRYNIGGEYKEHQDFFHPNTNYYESQMIRGGQRKYSALIYLNDNFVGGETYFPKIDYKVKPENGKLVIWENVNNDGSLNYNSLHAGLPVINGEKWICIVWVRETKFI
jgi:prolyl 4-hydroxylase